MTRVEKTKANILGFIKLTIRSRVTRIEKSDTESETGKKTYVGYYLPILKEDLRTLGLRVGDRLTVGIVNIKREPVPSVEVSENRAGDPEGTNDSSESDLEPISRSFW